MGQYCTIKHTPLSSGWENTALLWAQIEQGSGCSRNVVFKRLSTEGEADVRKKEERMSSEMNLNVKCKADRVETKK
jgi:hypothetical protein